MEALPPVTPFTSHVTAVLVVEVAVELPESATVAVNCAWVFRGTEALDGLMVIPVTVPVVLDPLPQAANPIPRAAAKNTRIKRTARLLSLTANQSPLEQIHAQPRSTRIHW